MPAVMRIDQDGLPDGVNDRSRSDGLLDGSPVLVTSMGGGDSHQLELLWIPDGDSGSLATFTQLDTTIWQFIPAPGCPGTYRLQLTVDGEVSVRELRVRTAQLKIMLPALNEAGDPTASLVNNGAEILAASEDNESEERIPPALSATRVSLTRTPFDSGNYAAWYRLIRDLAIQMEDRAAGLEPQGFARPDSLASGFGAGSRVEITGGNLVIYAPSETYFDVFIQGLRVRKDVEQSVALTTDPGQHWVHYDPTDQAYPLAVTSDPTPEELAEILAARTPVACVVWGDAGEGGQGPILIVDARHGLQMGPAQKVARHMAGAMWIEGMEPGSFTLGDGSLAAHAQFAIGDGTALAVDLLFAVQNGLPLADPQALTPVLDMVRFLYRNGPGEWWVSNAVDPQWPINALGAMPAHNADGATLAELVDGEFALVTYCAVKSIPSGEGDPENTRDGDRVVAIVGQAVFTALEDAQAAGARVLKDLDLEGLPSSLVPICSVIVECNTAYANGANARIVPTASGAAFLDHRPVGMGGAVDDAAGLGGGSSTPDLVSVPGLQGAAFAASGGNSYLVDPTLDTVATLADGTEDGQLVAFQVEAQVSAGGAMVVLGTMNGGASVGIGLGAVSQSIGAIRLRWNEPAGFWELYGPDVLLLLASVPSPDVALLWHGALSISDLEIPEGSFPVRPLGSTALEAKATGWEEWGPEMLDATGGEDMLPGSTAYYESVTGIEDFKAIIPDLTYSAEGDTMALKCIAPLDIGVPVVLLMFGIQAEDPITGVVTDGTLGGALSFELPIGGFVKWRLQGDTWRVVGSHKLA